MGISTSVSQRWPLYRCCRLSSVTSPSIFRYCSSAIWYDRVEAFRLWHLDVMDSYVLAIIRFLVLGRDKEFGFQCANYRLLLMSSDTLVKLLAHFRTCTQEYRICI